MRFLVVLGAIAAASCGISDEDSQADRLVVAAEGAVRRQLRDPGSATFSNVRAYPENGSVCGDVNAKNGFGGYTGDKGFVFVNGVAYLEEANFDLHIQQVYRGCVEGARIRAGNAKDRAVKAIED